MSELKKLINRIVQRVNINLRGPELDVGPYIRNILPMEKYLRFYAFYGLTQNLRLHFNFKNSSLSGSYFLGRCHVDNSVLYKSDIRGDELKRSGDSFNYKGLSIPLHNDEFIKIKDSFLMKTLVHNNSHDPENPEEFIIQNTVSMPYANIHGTRIEGSFLGPFSTVDLSIVHDCVIGNYAYIQVGEISHQVIQDGQVWIHGEDSFDFGYVYPPEVLKKYVDIKKGKQPHGIFMDFVEKRKDDFEQVFRVVRDQPIIPVPSGSALSRYSVVKGYTQIRENVLVAQRAYLENAVLGKGANAQEQCYIVNSVLEGDNVTAHGGKIINARLGRKVFVGFNSFIRGNFENPLTIGAESIVMPHTIIDASHGLEIPPGHIVWGYISSEEDLKENSIAADELAKVDRELRLGRMRFQGNGAAFVDAFRQRIDHILEENGAFYDGSKMMGHAQKNQTMSFNIIQPYLEGKERGIYPTIDIQP